MDTRYRERQRAKWRTEGLCIKCGDIRREGTNRCQKCWEQRKLATEKAREKWKAAGRCVNCGKPREDGNRFLKCGSCRLKEKARRCNAISAGLCVDCRSRRPEAGKQKCTQCILSRKESTKRTILRNRWNHVASYSTGRRINGNALRAIMETQQYRCKLCGTPLDINTNASPDHIQPLAKGGTNDIHNIQWLCWVCNMMKRDHLQNDFLDHVRRIYRWTSGRPDTDRSPQGRP
jgi:hypothetical protein